jgi:2-dehydro-3-deoxyphosphogluconate aldolase/(4S)-4-hydroxy-2-oxoglutarate aldolase
MTAGVGSRAETVAHLRDVGIIPIIRAPSADVAVRVAGALVAAGITVAEVTMTVPDALSAIATLTREHAGRLLVGAGTVTDVRTAERAIEAGARFLVSPCLTRDVMDVGTRHDVALVPGALTPTEIFQAVTAGADLVKVFPVQNVGGASYLRALRSPFPDLPLVPTGGVTLESVGDYIRAGAVAVGVGGELVQRAALARGDYDAIGSLGARFVQAVKSARAG